MLDYSRDREDVGDMKCYTNTIQYHFSCILYEPKTLEGRYDGQITFYEQEFL